METEDEKKPNLADVNAICRVCLTQNDELKDILSERIGDLSILDMFNSITDFKVKEDDGFSKRLCIDCLVKLNVCYNFLNQIEQSYVIFQKRFSEDDVECVFEVAEVDVEDEKNPKPQKEKQKKHIVRLEQFSHQEVTQAIEESKRRFFENTECVFCGFCATNSRALAVHISHLHKDVKNKWCAHCNIEVEDLETHQTAHSEDTMKCRFCGKSFQSHGHLTEHLRSHMKVRPFKCTDCDKSFISSRHLKVHSRTHTNERPYHCILCRRTFAQLASLKNHLKTHSEEKFPCTACDSIFPDQNTLTSHDCDLKNSEGYAQNYCNKCKKKVRSLSVHMKTKHSAQGIQRDAEVKLCTVCGKQCKTATKLKLHMRIHTRETPYKCRFCERRFITRHNVVVHERTHTGEKPHVCSVCGKRFSQSSILNTHMRLHTGRPEVCNLCGKRFCRPTELRLHMRRHTGEKPFLCVHCGQSFVQRSHLTDHSRTHSDERPFKCTHCDKAFKQKSVLNTHLQIHLGYRVYRCNQCPYVARQSYCLTQHMARHGTDIPRADKPHVCLLCHKGFSTMAMLLSHTSNVHDANMLNG